MNLKVTGKSIAIILVISSIFLLAKLGQKKQTSVSTTPVTSLGTSQNQSQISDPDGGLETAESSAKEKNVYVQSSGTKPTTANAPARNAYKDYSTEIVAEEQRTGNKVVLFFYAPWCPYCRAADAVFKAKPQDIPSGVTVLKTDYDSNTDLKRKYGVTYQHTFVQIDAQGDMVSKWNGGDIDNLIKYIK